MKTPLTELELKTLTLTLAVIEKWGYSVTSSSQVKTMGRGRFTAKQIDGALGSLKTKGVVGIEKEGKRDWVTITDAAFNYPEALPEGMKFGGKENQYAEHNPHQISRV